MIAVTGANGQLGKLVIKSLLEKTDASSIVALVRSQDKAQDLAKLGVQVRHADYNQPNTLAPALEGVEKLLLISSSEVGQRAAQHQAVIEAVKNSSVNLLAYTSILKADSSALILAQEHKLTEQAIHAANIPAVILRNGWYNENFSQNLAGVLQSGIVAGAAQDGQFSSASRADYAQAAANVLTSPQSQAGKVYELAGDYSFSQQEYADDVAKQSKQAIQYLALSEKDLAQAFISHGLPEGLAVVLADSDVQAQKDWLFDDSGDLSALIGRNTTSMSQSIKEALELAAI